MGKQKTIQFMRTWRVHQKDQVVTMNAPIAALLIQRSIAVEVKPETKAKTPKIELKK